MYQVLIAEDEPIVRKGLRDIIHWAALGMQVVAEAADGKDALARYNEYHPDILLTDLRMPILDGISLIRKIREANKRIRIIILTCLDDFSMLQQALSLGVSSYLLKVTAEPIQIERILENVKIELDAQSNDLFHDQYIDYSLIKEQIMDDFIFYRKLPIDVFTDYVKRLGMRLSEQRLILAAIRLPNYDKLIETIQDEHGRKLRSMLLNIINKRLAGHESGEVHRDTPASYLLIYNCRAADEEQARSAFRNLLTELKTDIQSLLEVDILYGISSLFDGFARLPEKRDEALADLENRSQSTTNPKVELLKKYAGEHYTENISLQSAADYAGITASYASHLFTQYAGISFTVHLNDVRIEKAKQILKTSTYMVNEISRQVGFWDATYFIRVFRKHTGYSPDEYRKKVIP